MVPPSRDVPAERLLAESAWVQSLARRLVGDAHLADDLSQEALTAALARVQGDLSARPVRELRPWLHGIVSKLWHFDRRSALRRERREREAARPERCASSPEQTLLRAERIQRVGSAVLELDEPYRSTVLLRFLDELPVAEVAARMGVAPSTVRVRTKRALETLHERLLADWGDDHGAYSLALVSIAGAPTLGSVIGAGTTLQNHALLTGMKLQLKIVATLLVIVTSGSVWLATRGSADEAAPVTLSERAAAIDEGEAGDTGAEDEALLSSTTPATSSSRRAAELVPAAPNAASTASTERASFGETTLLGRVIDGTGEPVSSARVALFPQIFRGARALGSAGLSDPIGSVLSSPNGDFRFESLADFAMYGLRASADGFVETFENSAPGKHVELVLRSAVRLHGRVLESDGATPVADTLVVCPGPVTNKACRTRADGSYELLSLEGGTRHQIEIFPSGCIPADFVVQLPAQGETRHDLVLPPTAAFAGRVVDAESRQPVPNAQIHGGRAGQHVATADAEGRFQIDVEAAMLERERNQSISIGESEDSLTGAFLGGDLRAEAPGYTPTSAPLWVSEHDSELEFMLPLSRAGRIAGRVTHPGGAPAVGAVVGWKVAPCRIFGAGAQTLVGSDSRRVQTDAEGRFELPHVPWGPSYGGELELRHGNHAPVLVGDACPASAGETRYFELVLGASAGLRGRVLVNGSPEHAYVYLRAPGDGLERQFETDELGRFSFQGLEPGSYLVRACTGDGSAIFSQDHELSFPLPRGELALIRIDADFELVSGRVVDTSGAPLAGVRVRAFPQRGQGVPGRGGLLSGSAATDADGSFRIRLEQRSESEPFFTVSAFHGQAYFEQTDVRAGRDDLEYVLPRLRWASLWLSRAQTGAPLASARLSWRDEASGLSATINRGIELPATSEGLLRVELPVGSIELEVSAPSLEIGAFEQSITISANGPEPEIDVGI